VEIHTRTGRHQGEVLIVHARIGEKHWPWT
jgi:hypothetical protein